MTFAEALNQAACSCGLEEGRTWFADSNGDEPETVGDYRLLHTNNGVQVEFDDGEFLVTAVGPDEKQHWARFNSDYMWDEV